MPSTNKPEYVYDRNGQWWYIYKMRYFGLSSYGEKVSDPFTKKEAETETYRLNGWTNNKPTI